MKHPECKGVAHAGNEAAAAATYRSCQVLLIIMGTTKLGQVSCNPVTRGVVKGQLERGIDVLGGLSGIVTDESMLRLRLFNRSKGPASGVSVLGVPCPFGRPLALAPGANLPPSTSGRIALSPLSSPWTKTHSGRPLPFGQNLHQSYRRSHRRCLPGGAIHIGLEPRIGERMGEPASYGLTEPSREIGFETGRLKTGPPPRLEAEP
jgi:tRNA uridine 5-carboxymethylaminomethyl modification enzyme